MTTNTNLSCRAFTIKSTIFLFLLISLVTSLQGLAIGRKKRGTVTIGDLPSIRPPTILKNGEAKYPNPGWTHCIKYLTADVRWRSIRSVNMKKLQATQFQCSWYISSEVPGSQIRVSFQKLNFGVDGSNACTQQFLELIDIRSGSAQARMCGNRRYGDYVSMGQRVRIDIQGEESLVEKLRSNEEPFIINYKVVKEPAGFRIGGTSKATVLKNKVKHTVGTAVDRTTVERGKNIFGSKNQPGANDPPHSDTESDGKPSLTIWQVVIIIVISFAVVFCIVGVIIKRMVFDKEKKEKCQNSDEGAAEDGIKGEKPHELPGFTKVPSAPEKRDLERNNPPDTAWTENELPRSKSKPETATKKTHKTERHNSHGDVVTKPRVSKHQKKSNGDQKPPITNGMTKHQTIQDSSKLLETDLVGDTPLSRAPRENASKSARNTTTVPPRTLRHTGGGVTKKNRKTAEKDNKAKSRNPDKKKLDNAAKKNRSKRSTESKRKKKTAEKVSTKTKPTKPCENETPLTRAAKSRPKRSRPKNRREKDQHTKTATTKQNGETKLKRNDETLPEKGPKMRKKREHSKGDTETTKTTTKTKTTKTTTKTTGTKRPKTVSSGHKKTTAVLSGKTTSKKKTHAHRSRSANKDKSNEKKRHKRKSPKKTTLTHTKDVNSKNP